MTEPRRSFLSLLRQFHRNGSGVAAVEFALIAPLMLTLYIGTVEAGRLVSYDRRLTSAASALGDLVSQTNGDLTESELDDLFDAAKITVAPYDASGLEQVVSCLLVDADGNATVVWSYGYNGGVAHTVDASFDLPGEFTDIASDTYVIVSEASMDYSPITGYIFDATIPLEKTYYYLPRYGEFIDVTS